MSLEVVTVASRPDLDADMGEAFRGEWPEFIFHDPVSRALVDQATDLFPDFNLLVLSDGRFVAGGWGVLVAWDGARRQHAGDHGGRGTQRTPGAGLGSAGFERAEGSGTEPGT